MDVLILVLHTIAAISIIGLVLLQHGKGADMGAAFGSGSAGSVFGSSGSANFLSRATAVMAAVFFVTSISLTVFSSHKSKQAGLMTKPVDTSPIPNLPSSVPTAPVTQPNAAVPVPSAPAEDGKK